MFLKSNWSPSDCRLILESLGFKRAMINGHRCTVVLTFHRLVKNTFILKMSFFDWLTDLINLVNFSYSPVAPMAACSDWASAFACRRWSRHSNGTAWNSVFVALKPDGHSIKVLSPDAQRLWGWMEQCASFGLSGCQASTWWLEDHLKDWIPFGPADFEPYTEEQVLSVWIS